MVGKASSELNRSRERSVSERALRGAKKRIRFCRIEDVLAAEELLADLLVVQ
ncbi:hypothetical protein SAMN05421752_103202 [Natronorubrum thiooxidans]|uniref:Uncharacterized protein n=1 Tax=Natronorubrum thiooxidans TaxID=308853 RepID=A0A1N7E4R8_9EURY|nr:hypothetical protein SAMN05421752_103202 [Natronorubrum thiooxidans]